MLYTRKGDGGTTGLFSAKGGPASGWGCDQRISKSSNIAEALGSLDEINSFLGLLKIKTGGVYFSLPKKRISVPDTIDHIQQDLFIIQAQIAGAEKVIAPEKIIWLEEIIDSIEKKLPPIKTFFVPGGTELSALSDVARTIARRAERRVIAVSDEGKIIVNKESLAYLNRLSSVLYAFVRNFNRIAFIKEETPKYK